MSEKMTREDIVRIARECDIQVSEGNTFADDCYISVLYRLANKAIEHFLATTGQYVTNDASREAAIMEAVEAERSKLARLLRIDAGYVYKDECSCARDAVNYCVALVEAERGK